MKKAFITGGSSGIGEGLASALHAKGIKVIIGARNVEALKQITRRHEGMESVELDVANPASVERCAAELSRHHPDLDTLINNAGIQNVLDFTTDPLPTIAEASAEIETNLKGLIHVTLALLPALKRQPSAEIINVTSGLAFVPLVQTPVYSATKAAARAFTISLREQLKGSTVRVRELIPPLVATNLHRKQAVQPSNAMALDDFIDQSVTAIFGTSDEMPIGGAKFLKVASRIAPGRLLKMINSRGR